MILDSHFENVAIVSFVNLIKADGIYMHVSTFCAKTFQN
jgi:hypothetical protein